MSEIEGKIEVPSGIELLQEKVKSGQTYEQLAEKYNCSFQNIHNKIQKVINNANDEDYQAYLKDKVKFLKVVESINIIESIQPEKLKKTSSTQHMINAKIAHQMVQETEYGYQPPVNIQVLINDYRQMILQEQEVKCKDNAAIECKAQNGDMEVPE